MADKSTTPQIETRFVLNGLNDALHQMSSFTSKIKGEFGGMEKAAAVNLNPKMAGMNNTITGLSSLGSKASAAFQKFGSGASKAISSIGEHVGKLGSSLTNLTRGSVAGIGTAFSSAASTAKFAIGGIGLAIGGLVTSLGGVGSAAAKMSLAFSNKVDDLGDKASAIGFKPVELQGLDLIASQAGLETDAMIQGIAVVSTSAKQLFDGFNQQDKKFAETLEEKSYEFNKAKELYLQAQANPTSTSGDQMKDAYDAMKAAQDELDEVRMQSYNESKVALAQLYAVDKSQLNDDQLHQLTVRTHKYQNALSELENSAGSAGSALLKMHEKYGLNLEEVSKGAPEALKEILRVFPQITDATERLQRAMDLFGAKPGRKFVGLLQGGIGGFDAALAKVKALGADIQDVDSEIADSWDATNHEFGLATDGIRKTIARSVTPEITRAVNLLNDFMVKNNQAISDYFIRSFERAKKFLDDIFGLMNGQTSGFNITLFDNIAPTLQYARREFGLFSDDVNAAFSGQESGFNFGFMNVVVPAIKDATEAMIEFNKELQLSWDGESKWGWLNTVMSSAQATGRAIDDLYTKITTGADSAEFPWVDALVEMFKDLYTWISKTFELIVDVAEYLSGPIGQVLKYISVGVQTTVIDPATAATKYAADLAWNVSPYAAEENALFEATRQGMVYDNEQYFKNRQLNNARLNSGAGETVNVNIVAPDGQKAQLKATRQNADAAVDMLQALSGRTAGGF